MNNIWSEITNHWCMWMRIKATLDIRSLFIFGGTFIDHSVLLIYDRATLGIRSVRDIHQYDCWLSIAEIQIERRQLNITHIVPPAIYLWKSADHVRSALTRYVKLLFIWLTSHINSLRVPTTLNIMSEEIDCIPACTLARDSKRPKRAMKLIQCKMCETTYHQNCVSVDLPDNAFWICELCLGGLHKLNSVNLNLEQRVVKLEKSLADLRHTVTSLSEAYYKGEEITNASLNSLQHNIAELTTDLDAIRVGRCY